MRQDGAMNYENMTEHSNRQGIHKYDTLGSEWSMLRSRCRQHDAVTLLCTSTLACSAFTSLCRLILALQSILQYDEEALIKQRQAMKRCNSCV